MVKANAINVSTTGIIKFDGTTFSTTAVTPFCAVVGDTSNNITSIGPGTARQVLQSGGVAANPAYSTAKYPATAGTTRKILISNGTDFVSSTETYAVPGTSGNIMTSDGTNWTSAAYSGATINTFSTTITNAQLAAGSTVTLIAAPGAGNSITILSVDIKFVNGSADPFTNTPTGTVGYSSTSNFIAQVSSATFWQATTNRHWIQAVPNGILYAASNVENKAIQWLMSTGTTGNPTGDNTVKIYIKYATLAF